VAINNPVPWSRKRPDGFELKWLLSLATGEYRGVAPFLIEDVTPRSERIPREFSHDNGVIGIEKVTVAVSENAPIEKCYGALLGDKGIEVIDATLRAAGLGYRVGAHRLDFLAPQDAASPLSDWLREFGPSPYSALIKSENQARRSFAPRLTHGARLMVA
jgi:hypothetical protein